MKKRLIGKLHSKWKGMNVTRTAKHIWLKAHYGKAYHCENNPNCKAKNFQWCNISKKYFRERSDYKQLCVRCHRFFDIFTCKRGHPYTKTNTRWSRGRRFCRICAKIYLVRAILKRRLHNHGRLKRRP